jgi:hypothetical protein
MFVTSYPQVNPLVLPSRCDIHRIALVAGSGSVTNVSRGWWCWYWYCHKYVAQVVLLAVVLLALALVTIVSPRWCC